MKKLLFLFVLLLSSIGMSAVEFEVNGLKYNILTTEPDYTVELIDYNHDYDGELVLNGTVTYNEQIYKVVQIKGASTGGNNKFYNCNKSLVINSLPYCITIDDNAFFNCKGLKSVGNLNSCTSIGVQAFQNCSNLTSIGNLDACTSIGSYAFSGCSDMTTIGSLGVCESIGNGAFYNCNKLNNIGNLSSCTSIGNYAFRYCRSLNSIGDLSNCLTIGINAFEECNNLFCSMDLSSCTSLGDKAFLNCPVEYVILSLVTPPVLSEVIGNQGTTFLVPASAVETYRAADYWSDIKLQIISKDATHTWDVQAPVLTSIGADQFENVMTLKVSGNIDSDDIKWMRNKMANLHHLDMTNATIVASDNEYYTGCTTSDNSVGGFFDMIRLRTVKLPSTAKIIEARTFRNCTNLHDVVFTEGIERIDGGGSSNYGAFNGCNSLTTIQLPEGLKRIGGYSFSYCNSLKVVAFPASLERIDDYAFVSTPLVSVSFPNKLIHIGEYAFENNSLLKELRIPSSLESIGQSAFKDCNNLKDIYTYTVQPVTINSNTFSTYAAATLHCPTQGFNDYYASPTWGQFPTLVEFNEPYKYFYITDDFVLLSGKRFDTPQGEDLDINAHAGSSITIEGETNQAVGNIDIHDNGTSGASVIPDNNLTAKTVTFHLQVGANKWRFFCFPFRVYLNKVEAPGSYVFRRYNGSNRALGNSGWESLPVETEYLEAGVGYIYQCNNAGTLKITVSTPDFNWATSSKTTTLTAYAAANDQDASWNFVGNPMTNYYDIDDMHYDAPLTVWNGTSYVAYRPNDDNYQLQPFEAYFVQKPNDSSVPTYDKDKRMGHNAAEAKHNNKVAAAARRMAPGKHDRHLLNLVLSNGEQSDQTRVVFNEKKTAGYERECDAAKFMSMEQVPQLYTLEQQTQYAINERQQGSVQVGFTAPKAGSYTLKAERMDMPMVLKDAMTGITHDLNNGEYTFESEAGTFNQRFMLMPAVEPTGIEAVKATAEADSPAYRLDGRRAEKGTKGIVVEKGKKVVK